MSRFSIKQLLKSWGVSIGYTKDNPKFWVIKLEGVLGGLIIIIILTLFLTILLLFISSLGGTPFKQSWTFVPIFLCFLIMCSITTLIDKLINKRKNKQDE
jgi:hypothetical protein